MRVFWFSTTSCMVMSMNFGKFWIQMIFVACYVFLHKLFDIWIVVIYIESCTLYPQQCMFMFISLILQFSHKKIVLYFSEKCFIMACCWVCVMFFACVCVGTSYSKTTSGNLSSSGRWVMCAKCFLGGSYGGQVCPPLVTCNIRGNFFYF